MVRSTLQRADQEASFPEGPALSNLGEVALPDRYGPLRLLGLSFSAAQLAGLHPLFCSVVTLAGRTHACLSWAEPLLGAEAAEAG